MKEIVQLSGSIFKGPGDRRGLTAVVAIKKTSARPEDRAPLQSGRLRPSLGRLAVPAEPVNLALLRRQRHHIIEYNRRSSHLTDNQRLG